MGSHALAKRRNTRSPQIPTPEDGNMISAQLFRLSLKAQHHVSQGRSLASHVWFLLLTSAEHLRHTYIT
jgi:hypothetical protein